MTEKECAKVLSIISAIWPQFIKDRDPKITVNVWSRLFEKETYDQVSAAVMAYAETDTKGFAPMPGALKNLIAQASQKDLLTETEAWAKVSRALRNGIYGYEEEYKKLPAEIQSALGDAKILHEWAMLDEDQVQTVVASNFQRSYRARLAYNQESAKISDGMRERLAGLIRTIPDGPARLNDGQEGFV